MQRVFLSMSFQASDAELVSAATDLIQSQDLLVVAGRDLGGAPLNDEIKARIDASDALVSICTRRGDPLQDNTYATSTWVRDELFYAKAKEKPALALVEEGVGLGGMLQPYEVGYFTRSTPLAAFSKLARTIAQWRQNSGMTLKAVIVPAEVALQLAKKKVGSVEFCAVRANGEAGDWRKAPVVREIGGLYAYLSGVPRDALVMVRATSGGKVYESVATALHYYVSLDEDADG